MRSSLEASSFRIVVLASGLAMLSAACGSSSGTPSGAGGSSASDAGGDVKSDSGPGDVPPGDSGAGGKADSGAGGMMMMVDAGMGGAMLVPPWHAFLPLNVAAAGSGTANGTLLDLSPNHYDATYFGTTISFANGSMNLTGVGSETVVVPPKGTIPAVDVTGSYSVSAWVTLTNAGGFRTVVSGEGVNISSFFLQKRADTNAWAFTTIASDAIAAPGCIVPGPATPDGGPAPSPVTPVANMQYHLVGTADATTGMHILYVNGVESGRLGCGAGPSWADTGVLGIGHGIFASNRVDNVQGAIAEVGVINRVLTPAEVTSLYARGRMFMPPPVDAGPDLPPATDSGTDVPSTDAGTDVPAGNDAPPATDGGDNGG